MIFGHHKTYEQYSAFSKRSQELCLNMPPFGPQDFRVSDRLQKWITKFWKTVFMERSKKLLTPRGEHSCLQRLSATCSTIFSEDEEMKQVAVAGIAAQENSVKYIVGLWGNCQSDILKADYIHINKRWAKFLSGSKNKIRRSPAIQPCEFMC